MPDTSSEPKSLIEPRRDYISETLSRSDLAQSPIKQFELWLRDARERKLIDATAMSLATADADGQPHSRMVLLKQFDEQGFVWYTNRQSDKGRQLAANAQAALLFFWCALERQVRIEGTVSMLPDDLADDYFHQRPQGSRFSAAASRQSTPVDNRAVLEAEVRTLRERYPAGDVPRPEAWGGYRLAPVRMEFWQGRSDRLHDRFVYTRNTAETAWRVQRLSP